MFTLNIRIGKTCNLCDFNLYAWCTGVTIIKVDDECRFILVFFSVLNKKCPFYYIQWHFQEHAANSITFTETLDLICQTGYE